MDGIHPVLRTLVYEPSCIRIVHIRLLWHLLSYPETQQLHTVDRRLTQTISTQGVHYSLMVLKPSPQQYVALLYIQCYGHSLTRLQLTLVDHLLDDFHDLDLVLLQVGFGLGIGRRQFNLLIPYLCRSLPTCLRL